MDNRREVCAVVVTYNRKDLVNQCIQGILNQKQVICDIIVIDNGSQDGTEELFNTSLADDRIRYINMGSNLGCAAGTSRGIKEAVESGYKYIWVMDDDVFPHENTLCELLKADELLSGKWGILSSVAYWIDGSLCKANIQKKGVFKFLQLSDYRKPLVEVAMVSLASMFIKADVVKKVGLPISEYFIYTEDYEFCSRVRRVAPIYVVTASKVTHAMNVNSKVNFVKDTEDRLYRYKYLYRNDVHCYRKLGVKGNIYLLLKFCYTSGQIIFSSTNNKGEKLRVLFSGYAEGIHFSPTIERIT